MNRNNCDDMYKFSKLLKLKTKFYIATIQNIISNRATII